MKTRSVLTAGTYTTADYDAAEQEPVILAPPADVQHWLAPQFVLQVRHQLGDDPVHGRARTTAPRSTPAATRSITTLDWRHAAARREVDAGGAQRPEREGPGRVSQGARDPLPGRGSRTCVGAGVHNAALAAIDYRTGQVFAYVGSAGFYLAGQQASSSPSSTCSPTAGASPAPRSSRSTTSIGIDDHSITAASMFMDVVTDFGGGYTPTDADLLERGPGPAARGDPGLAQHPGDQGRASRSGPTTSSSAPRTSGSSFQSTTNTAGSSIAIGTLEVHLIDLISAYGAIANGGVLMPRTTILAGPRLHRHDDLAARRRTPQGTAVVSPQAAFIMTDILAGNTDPAQNPFWSKRAIYDGNDPAPGHPQDGHDERHEGPHGDGVPRAARRSESARVRGRRLDGQLRQLGPAGRRGLARDRRLALAGVPDGGDEGPADRRLRSRRPAWCRRRSTPITGMLPGPFSAKTVKEWFIDGTAPTQVDNTKVARPDRRGDRQALAGRLPGPGGDPGLPRPEQRRGRLSRPGSRSPTAGSRAPRRGPACPAARRRRSTSYFYETGVWTPYGPDLGCPVPAHRDVRRRHPVAGAVAGALAVLRPVRSPFPSLARRVDPAEPARGSPRQRQRPWASRRRPHRLRAPGSERDDGRAVPALAALAGPRGADQRVRGSCRPDGVPERPGPVPVDDRGLGQARERAVLQVATDDLERLVHPRPAHVERRRDGASPIQPQRRRSRTPRPRHGSRRRPCGRGVEDARGPGRRRPPRRACRRPRASPAGRRARGRRPGPPSRGCGSWRARRRATRPVSAGLGRRRRRRRCRAVGPAAPRRAPGPRRARAP